MKIHFPGLRIGHITNVAHRTGLTVFLPTQAMRCARWICGAAPASRECDLLAPEQMVDKINALLFTGGSAFGLDAAQGIMRWLREQERGWPTHFGVVPIVPAAAIYDFQTPNSIVPEASDAWHACQQATEEISAFGQIGAGTGAMVGKLLPFADPMPGGFGYAQVRTPKGLNVTACAVVNCAGDVYRHQKIIAGARLKNGDFANTRTQLLTDNAVQTLVNAQTALNTTLVAVFTNGRFDKNQLTRIARMASAGMAQAIAPAFTTYDGDMVFCLSSDEQEADEILIGTLAAETTRRAIIQACTPFTLLD